MLPGKYRVFESGDFLNRSGKDRDLRIPGGQSVQHGTGVQFPPLVAANARQITAMPVKILITAMPAVYGFIEVVWGGCAMGLLFKTSDIRCWTGPVFGCLFQCAGGGRADISALYHFLAVLTRVPVEMNVPDKARCLKSNGE